MIWNMIVRAWGSFNLGKTLKKSSNKDNKKNEELKGTSLKKESK